MAINIDAICQTLYFSIGFLSFRITSTIVSIMKSVKTGLLSDLEASFQWALQ